MKPNLNVLLIGMMSFKYFYIKIYFFALINMDTKVEYVRIPKNIAETILQFEPQFIKLQASNKELQEQYNKSKEVNKLLLERIKQLDIELSELKKLNTKELTE